MNEEIRAIGFCPHCGNTAPQMFFHGLSSSPPISPEGPKDTSTGYAFVLCMTCQRPLLYRSKPGFSGPLMGRILQLEHAELVWPNSLDLHESIPASVRKCYSEAALVKSRAPNAFANQIRRSLEAVCKDREATGKTLFDKLKDLESKGEIPATLVSMTDLIRKLGNWGSHAAEQEVGKEHVNAIDDFFRAIVEYVYVAPFKVKKIGNDLKIDEIFEGVKL